MSAHLAWHGTAATAEVVRHLLAALDSTGAAIATEAQNNLYPGHGYETGALKESLVYEPAEGRAVPGPVGTVHDGVPYGAYVELGTVHLGPITFLSPAIGVHWPATLEAEAAKGAP